MNKEYINNLVALINKELDRYVSYYINDEANEYIVSLYDQYDYAIEIFARHNDVFVTLSQDNQSCIADAHDARAEQASQISLNYPLTGNPYGHVTYKIPDYVCVSKTIKILANSLEDDTKLILNVASIIFKNQPVTQEEKDFISELFTAKPARTPQKLLESVEIPF